ncbi:MAG: DoxX family protein [Azospira oryzae]|jgi:uncharacterized membrane protein|nr:MAG: DoxX family protein [Azospira oryzae]
MTSELPLYVMAFLYLAAGINHFVNPGWYLKIIPSWIPFHKAVNYLSGVCEIVFAIMLLPMATRSAAAWLIIALLIAVLPANIQMSINFWKKKHRYFWITLVRIPFQLVLMAWAWLYTN